MTRREAIGSIGLGILNSSARGAASQITPKIGGKLTVQVEDEFAPLRVALVHDASNAVDMDWEAVIENIAFAEERGRHHPETGPVSAAKVMREMAQFRKLLAEFKVEIVTPSPIEGVASQLFTRDPLFAIGKTAFLGSLRDEHREIEFEALVPITERLPKVVDLAIEDSLIEGGDVMVLNAGKTVLVGTNTNTNEVGSAALARSLNETGARVVRIRHHRLHLDCCLAPLPNGSALLHERTLSRRSLPLLKEVFKELIPLDSSEAYRSLAANLLWLDPQNVVSAVSAKKTNHRLQTLGYKVHALDFTNVKRMWGNFRCVTCPIQRG